MKKIIIMGLLVSIMLTSYSQSFDGFFKPFNKQQFDRATLSRGLKGNNIRIWDFRPVVEVSAIKLTYDKEAKQVYSGSFTSMGFGLGLQCYVDNNGVPYNNFGFNALFLYTAIPTEETDAGIAFALTVSALKFIDLGFGYDITMKQPFGLMGIKYNF